MEALRISGRPDWKEPSRIKLYQIPYSSFKTDFYSGMENGDLKRAVNFIEKRRIAPGPVLAEGIKLARTEISNLQKEFGLNELPHSTMDVAVLSENDFKRLFMMVSGVSWNGLVAGYLQDLDSVLVMDRNVSSYAMATTAYHELVHKHIDAHVQALARKKTGLFGREKEFKDNRRSGLKVRYFPKQGVRSVIIGELLNELGNHLEEARFTKILLEMPFYKAEADKRDRILTDVISDPVKGYMDFGVRIGNTDHPVRIVAENMHPHKEGKVPITHNTVLRQLVSDLETVCDLSSGTLTFRKRLLEAKIDPSKQNSLKELLDGTFGNGFFRDLKTTENRLDYDLVVLIAEVQSRLYPDLY
jgi:hypothetical protein